MISVIDTETTGLDPENASVIELAAVQIPGFKFYNAIIKPRHPIEILAMAAHHLTEDMVAHGMAFEEAMLQSMIDSSDYVAAHNSAFDSGFVPLEKPWICTWRCSRQIWPDAPGHSNQALRYYLGLNDKLYSSVGRAIMKAPPHRALPDAWVTAHILQLMLETYTPDDLVTMTSQPILMKKIVFGQYRGKEWTEVPKDYLRWIIRQELKKKGSFDRDTLYTARFHLGILDEEQSKQEEKQANEQN